MSPPAGEDGPDLQIKGNVSSVDGQCRGFKQPSGREQHHRPNQPKKCGKFHQEFIELACGGDEHPPILSSFPYWKILRQYT